MVTFFFFSSRRRHTRSYGDWSSDVCSSDLPRWIGGEVLYRISRGGEIAEDLASAARGYSRIGCAEIAQEFAKLEGWCLAQMDQLVRLDVTALLQEHGLEDTAPQRRQALGNDRRAPA